MLSSRTAQGEKALLDINNYQHVKYKDIFTEYRNFGIEFKNCDKLL